MVRDPALQSLAWVHHGFTTREGGLSTVYRPQGDLNLGLTVHDDAALVKRNRVSLLPAFSSNPSARLLTLRQLHGTAILPIRRPPPDFGEAVTCIGEGDALVTAEPGLLLGIQVADCVPVLLADPRLRVVATAHAGWRGTASAIVQATVARMASEYASRPSELIAAIGPSIGPCCYLVGEEVLTTFHTHFSYAADLFRSTPTGPHLDLWQANRRQLLDAGLAPSNIHITGECTACTLESGRRKYFSHRAEHGFTGRAMGIIGIVPPAQPSGPPPAP